MCRDIKNDISSYMNRNIHIDFRIIDLDDETIDFEKRSSSITPALWVDNRMWYAGSFKIDSFESKLKDLLHKKGEYHE